MNTMIDLTGRKFGKLTVLEKAESSHTPNGNVAMKSRWLHKSYGQVIQHHADVEGA